MNIGLLVIATNKYIKFVDQLLKSSQNFFLKKHTVNMFVFTDSPSVPDGTIRVFQPHMPWPGSTLKRYHIFTKNSDILSKMDYLFYSDADMRFEGEVGDEVLGDLVATQHPGFWNQPYSFFSTSYENRPQSMAYMPPGYGKAYYAGGFNGGKAVRFLNMANTISQWIDQDEAKGIIAKWHDESHMNKYFADNPPSLVLSPAYCYQEEKQMPFPRKLVALKKNHEEWRS
jgi:histo-blood group ABO system transferase